MSKHTSFKIGGNADVLISPRNKEEVLSAVKICSENKLPFYIIGNGSNLLVSDKGFCGVIIKISKEFSDVSLINDTTIYCDAGILLSSLSAYALKNSLSGLEFASGIPGTLGGAVYMNAGAYDGEMKDVVVSADVLDADFNAIKLTNEELNFGYRTSTIEKENFIVLGAEIKLKHGNIDEIKAKTDDLNAQRRAKQPLDIPSAGSTFKRPKGTFAGKLIMDCGLRGYSIGGASVSEKHCGFIVNNGNATANDVLMLIEYVQNIVFEKFNILLKPEIRIIGE
jgi:UDP-N-acetylmuramate dehydrogenase